MNVFVTSSPFIDGAERAILAPDNEFIDRIRAVLPKNPQVLFVCSDPGDHEGTCQFAAITTAAFAEIGIAFGGYQVLDGTTAHRAYGMVSHCDFIVLSGGHVPTQNAFFRKIRLRHLLKHFNGTVMGISAGSMNMADIVYVQPEEPGESVPEFKRFSPGLGLTSVSILPHYQKVKDNYLDGKRLYEDITFADSMGHEFFVLPDNSYFFQDSDGLLLCGRAYRLKDGIMELLTLDGEVLKMEMLEQ
ncbi:MAG: Type 1 glutamine amidotransferase-like domain-containing protein [Oscillospiraceae bacterium]|nr:Type 1 glutamine amidotransferase-like domain-containing protein [Oscillospiraceae bacterium]